MNTERSASAAQPGTVSDVALRLVVVEDQDLLRDALISALTVRGVNVVGHAADVESAVLVIEQTRPDVAMLDIRLRKDPEGGLRIAEHIGEHLPEVGVLIVSDHGEGAYAERLLKVRDHAVGYVEKDRTGEIGDLLPLLRRVAAGMTVIDAAIVKKMTGRRRLDDLLAPLTPNERRVLELVAEGYSNAGIAEQTRQPIANVERCISAIFTKLDLPDRAERRDINPRVLAVLTYLRSAGRQPPHDQTHNR